jgi:DNA-binding NtrC family response regulator
MYSLPKSIFLVDDDCFHLEVMKQLLSYRGSTKISLFHSGIECLNHLNLAPELIFLDFDMDVYSGAQTLLKIKKYDPKTLVVIVSGRNNPALEEKLIQDGAFDFICKDDCLQTRLDAVLLKIEQHFLHTKKPLLNLNTFLQLFKFLG